MKLTKLTKGKFAMVDNEDFEYVNQWKWKYHKDGYAVRTFTGNKNIYMHRVINKTPKGLFTDRINRNKLDNRRSNLRDTTNSKNLMNTGIWKHNTSGIKGVEWNKQKRKWNAKIQVNKKKIHLGFFDNIIMAFLARKFGERLYHEI